jgi:DNA polymerase III subunit epsilon
VRPLVIFDVESTGTDVAKDRIVSIHLKVFSGLGGDLMDTYETLINPEWTMTDEVIAIHGITNEMVATAPKFREVADTIYALVSDQDLAGFNHTNFDIPILWEEFYRCGIKWDLSGVSIIDAGNIFKKKEERSLAAAVQFYCNRKHESAHSAGGDVDATVAVLGAQLMRYQDLRGMSAETLAAFSRFDDRVDLAGKIVRDKDGDPCYNIGTSKGVKVKNDLSFAYWMLSKDFPMQTKIVLETILESLRGQEDQEPEQEYFDQAF